MGKLTPELLYTSCDPDSLGFETTKTLESTQQVVGQDRAFQAMRFALGMRHDSFNLFVFGPAESGRHTIVRNYLEQEAKKGSTPDDWIYVNRFDDPNKPVAINLPAGKAIEFRDNMQNLVEELRTAVPAAFDSDEYRARRQEIEEAFKERQANAFEEIHKESESHDITLLRTPTGFVFAPLKNGQVIDPGEFEKLPEKERQHIEEVLLVLQERLEQILSQFPRWRRETNQQVRQLNHEVVMSAVGQLIDEIQKKYESFPRVQEYLDAVERNVIDNADSFRTPDEHTVAIPGMSTDEAEDLLAQYQVNVIVDNSACEGVPVIYETSPGYANLIGRVEHLAHMGALVTDFTLIKAGALHKANGGYLILDIHDVLTQPYAWEGLKNALRSKQLKMEALGQALSLISTVSLEPEPIPLDIKIVLIGERRLYYLLKAYDPEFSSLFKVAADFEDEMTRTEESCKAYAGILATLVKQHDLRELDKGAVARVIEHSARMSGDAFKLSTRLGKISDLLREADYCATEQNAGVVQRQHVQEAINQAQYRNMRVQEQILEEIERGTLMIATQGETIGQVNGLSVYMLGDYAFGHPVRITSRVRPGKNQVIDIEREVKLGGPIHSKGVLILSGFLSGRYAANQPLTLSASLVFEQSYGGVEGDSASSAELYALLSAISGVPLKQSYAVTGSINQLGEVQAIGGVNEKIEGFFDICARRGLTGEQGVLIPQANIKHLMLDQRVVEAVRNGQFSIHAVSNIDEGIEILTGVPAGEPNAHGVYPSGSVNALVEERLKTMAVQLHAFEKEHKSGD